MDERYMPEDECSAALRRFIGELNEAWHAAGTPSYARLEVLSAQLAQDGRRGEVKLIVLARSTTNEILAGKRAGAPKWVWVLSFVTALRAEASKSAVAAESIGTIDDWKRRHEGVCAAERAARHPLGAGLQPARAEGEVAGPVSLMAPPLEAAPPRRLGRHEEAVALRGKFLWLIKRAGGARWWNDYADAAPEWLAFYLYLESIARTIRVYEPGVVPGLLQVEEYARAVAPRYWPDAGAAEIAGLVELRMRRQRILREPAPRRLWAVMEESALRDQRAGGKVMRAQIRYLIDVIDQPDVAISLLPPGGMDDNATIREPFTIFRFGEPHLGDVACIEQPDGGLFLYRRDDIDHYSILMDILAIRAVTVKRDVQGRLTRILRESLRREARAVRRARNQGYLILDARHSRRTARKSAEDLMSPDDQSFHWEEAEKDMTGGIDASVPVSARIWNYWMGGKDYYRVDAEAGDQFAALYPGIRNMARASRLFIARAVTYLAAEAGIRQFLDIGTGLPSNENTHQVAQRVAADSRVVYVDNDPLVLAHARAILTGARLEATDYIDGDLNDPRGILQAAQAKLDFTQPVAIMLMGILGHIGHPEDNDDEYARSIVGQLKQALPPGGYLAVYEATNTEPAYNNAIRIYNETGAVPYHLRAPEQIVRLFDGLEAVDPGIVPIQQWRPDEDSAELPDTDAWGGVAVKR